MTPQGGMSSRAIASTAGVSQRTVLRDLAATEGHAALISGLDGKLYPGRRAPVEVREYLWGRVHYLRHEDGLSFRQIATVLSDEGFRRSVGWIASTLKDPCAECSGEASAAPEQSETSDHE